MCDRRRVAAVLARAMLCLGVGAIAVGAGDLGGPGGPGGPVAASVGDDPVHQSDEGLQPPVDPSRDPEETRRRAEEVLRGDEYQAPEQRDRTVLDRIREWLGDRIPDLDGRGAGTGSRILAYVIFAVVVLGGLAALTYVLVRARGTRRVVDEDPDADVDITPLRSPDEWGAEADRCERAGDHRGAVRARFRALTTTLARRDLVSDTPGRTVGELRDDVAERVPALGPAFDAAADLFERVWFAGGPAGPEQSAAARDLARAALAAAPRRVRAGGGADDADALVPSRAGGDGP